MRSKIGNTLISRKLRANQTDAETKLWNRIRNRQINRDNLSGRSRSAAISATSFAERNLSLSKSMEGSTQNRRATKCEIVI
jgi:hypothetical protein